jgi:hypothetical protein
VSAHTKAIVVGRQIDRKQFSLPGGLSGGGFSPNRTKLSADYLVCSVALALMLQFIANVTERPFC